MLYGPLRDTVLHSQLLFLGTSSFISKFVEFLNYLLHNSMKLKENLGAIMRNN